MMNRLIIPLLLIPFVLAMAACTRNTSAGSRDARPSTQQASAGKQIFQNNCIGCHGQDGTRIPGWRAAVQKMSDAQVRSTIKNGKSGGMPSFRGTLTDQQIAQVAAYAEQLARS